MMEVPDLREKTRMFARTAAGNVEDVSKRRSAAAFCRVCGVGR